MKGERKLIDAPFRYSGIGHDYTRTFYEITGKREKCYCCGGNMENNNGMYKSKPYCALFKITKGRDKGLNQFKRLCRACAYDYEKGVVEADGNKYFDKCKFDENKYFKEALK